jgi:hypothetical protein
VRRLWRHFGREWGGGVGGAERGRVIGEEDSPSWSA